MPRNYNSLITLAIISSNMATAPLPQEIIDRITSRNQSVRWTAVLREVRVFQAFFCAIDTDVIVGVSTTPVVNISITPNPVCLGNDITWDLSGSYAPGSSISSYAINFGDSNTDTGASGTHTYAAAGTYTITATVTSAAGSTQTATKEVDVVDCVAPILIGTFYSATDGSGVYVWET